MKYICNCEICGKEFVRYTANNENKPKFCSRKCYGKSRTNGFAVCPICGSEFKKKKQGKKDGDKVYCSQKCARESFRGRKSKRKILSDNQIQYLIDNYGNLGGDLIAETLGVKKSLVQSYAYKNNVRLNSNVYYETVHAKASEYMTENNPMFNQEVVDKVKLYWENNPEKKSELMESITKGKAEHGKKYGTKLERKMIEILDSFGIDYEYMFIVKQNFIVDFRVGNLIIQTDGDYWHGHQRFEPLTERQIAQQKRDRSQDKYLTTCGYKVIRIWESDLTKDIVEKILVENKII